MTELERTAPRLDPLSGEQGTPLRAEARGPAPAPLEMPVQQLDHNSDAARAERRRRRSRQTMRGRLVFTAVVTLTFAATWLFADHLAQALAVENGGTSAHSFFIVISALAFGWIAFGAANALIGVVAVISGRGRDTIKTPPATTPILTRTALLFPVYHEDPNEVADGIATLLGELDGSHVAKWFDVFVLSDTRTKDDVAREEAVFSALQERLPADTMISYRNRPQNIGKKAGNIGDWVTTYGGAYPHFIVFDADSSMTAATIIRLVAAMQSHPGTGLIQTVPRLRGATTFFGQLQAFANNLYAPLSAAGFAAWQGPSGNYWGHNAIIRTRAFASSAGLPTLPGPAPWGGIIQSHDFIEAAMMRRAGWRVALVTSLDGSHEGCPPALPEMAVRDRRWMQGNLQHVRVVSARGLAPISRLHIAFGIVAYLSSALWMLMLATGLYLIWQDAQRTTQYFDSSKSLFPNWPVFDAEAGMLLLIATMIVVLLPKILGLIVGMGRALRGPQALTRAAALLGGWLIEVIISALLAPVHMLLHVRFLVEILLRRDSGWHPQARDRSGMPFSEALRYHFGHVLVGIAVGIFAGSISWYALAWISPLVVGLILSPGLTWLTSMRAGSLTRTLLAVPTKKGRMLHGGDDIGRRAMAARLNMPTGTPA